LDGIFSLLGKVISLFSLVQKGLFYLFIGEGRLETFVDACFFEFLVEYVDK
jgi:hypothetical protein